MKVIDLLNKIANDEEIPEYIQYQNQKWKLSEIYNNYECISEEGHDWLLNSSIFFENLNNEIEIIEEPKTNFNIGDRVKVVKDSKNHAPKECTNNIGIVIQTGDLTSNIKVKFNRNTRLGEWWFLKDELELVEEPKEELEEIELLKTPRMWYASLLEKEDLPLDKECWNRLNSQEDKINELIVNQNKQNKIIRELKAKKGNE